MNNEYKQQLMETRKRRLDYEKLKQSLKFKRFYVSYRTNDGEPHHMWIKCEISVERKTYEELLVDGTTIIEISGYIDSVEEE